VVQIIWMRSGEDEFRFWGPIKPTVEPLWKRFYAGVSPMEFVHIVRSHLTTRSIVLEVGAGAGDLYPHGIRGTVRRIVGLDPDPRVLRNPQVDEGIVGRCEQLPFPDASFDLVFHRMLAEHLEDPESATREIGRVLKPDGIFLMHTPNILHYSILVSRVTPLWFHRAIMKMIGTRKNPKDVHVAYYRMNARRDVERICNAAGLTVTEVQFLNAPPGYLRFSRPSFLIGVAFQKLVEQNFKRLRPTLIVKAIKAGDRQ
jgi:SAM-dependent methyltransferase